MEPVGHDADRGALGDELFAERDILSCVDRIFLKEDAVFFYAVRHEPVTHRRCFGTGFVRALSAGDDALCTGIGDQVVVSSLQTEGEHGARTVGTHLRAENNDIVEPAAGLFFIAGKYLRNDDYEEHGENAGQRKKDCFYSSRDMLKKAREYRYPEQCKNSAAYIPEDVKMRAGPDSGYRKTVTDAEYGGNQERQGSYRAQQHSLNLFSHA